MRCLTLANTLRISGNEVTFISRRLKGNLIERIENGGFNVIKLSAAEVECPSGPPTHAAWAEISWQKDAAETREIVNAIGPDWLIVDHYAFDYRWEQATKGAANRLMVIDDLADRSHDCDALLDQNLGRQPEDYELLVPSICKLLIGPEFALLRPEFSNQRPNSLKRRENPKLRRLLINMGGIDKDNVTGRILDALKKCSLPKALSIEVILGKNAPHQETIIAESKLMPWPTEISIEVEDMARRMARADLSIGAAGSSSWERCCLGLPVIVLVLANNQKAISNALIESGAAFAVDLSVAIDEDLQRVVQRLQAPYVLKSMSGRASKISDGEGVNRILDILDKYES